jgi:hypothetical protein
MVWLMETHPIPQNVTSFEFHLVGDMTLKQFMYLGTGLGLAYLLYATLFYSMPFLAVPLIALSAGLGAAFAFLPIYDRPLDHWVKAFFKAVYSPTKGLWHSYLNPKAKITADEPIFKLRLNQYLGRSGFNQPMEEQLVQAIGPRPLSKNIIQKPIVFTPPTQQGIQAVISTATQDALQKEDVAKKQSELLKQSLSRVQQNQGKLPTNQDLNKLVEMAKEAQILQAKIADTEKLINQLTTKAQAQTNPAEFKQVSINLQNLINQTQELYKQTSKMSQTISAPLPEVKTPAPLPSLVFEKPKVSVVETPISKPTTLMLTSQPNVINGVVIDPVGNALEAVIVIIHNKDGVPVRALKTNKLGQFTGATPLATGTYDITLEKDGFSFKTLRITLDGSLLGPMNITANQQGVAHA